MKAFYIETCEGVIRDNADFMTPTDFIKANRKASLDINFFPPKCILNEFGISEIELYDIVNDENENNRLFTNRELEFRKGKRFTMDDIFYAFSIEYDQLTIDISDYISWKNRHKEWCEEKKRIVKQIESELCGDSALETELATCREQLDEARRDMSGNEKELTPKAKKSYLAVIAGLCRKSRPLDLSSRDAVSILKTEIEGDGLKLGDDTIRKIINEVRELERETPK